MDYIMLDIDGILTGTINVDMDLPEQALWVKALCLAGRGHGRVGFIERGVGVPYSKESLYQAFGCFTESHRGALDKMISTCLDSDDPRMKYDESGCLEIIKWDMYELIKKGTTREAASDRYKKHTKLEKEGVEKPKSKVTWDGEHKEARDKAMAYHGAFKNPDDAKAGIKAREFEDGVKASMKHDDNAIHDKGGTP